MARLYRYRSKPTIHDSRLGPYDILCGRTSHAYNNVGNRRFRVTIRMFLQRYQNCHSRADRKVFIYYLTKLCREEIGFRFLKQEAGDFHDIGEVETRKKIGHALLDQTVKHQMDATPAPQPTNGSVSPPVLIRKVTSDKKLKSILKKSPLRPMIPLQTPLLQSPPDQVVRRVSLPAIYEPFQRILPNAPSRSVPQQVPKKSLMQPKAIEANRVSKLESEVCMLLVGMHKQPMNPTQQCTA